MQAAIDALAASNGELRYELEVAQSRSRLDIASLRAEAAEEKRQALLALQGTMVRRLAELLVRERAGRLASLDGIRMKANAIEAAFTKRSTLVGAMRGKERAARACEACGHASPQGACPSFPSLSLPLPLSSSPFPFPFLSPSSFPFLP